MSLNDTSAKKRKEKKAIGRQVTLHSLPPCKVCGCASSGIHYGAATCEACKTFFRRTLINKRGYTCRNKQKPGTCTSSQDRKCAYCRLHKCHDNGMSLEAVTMGRYTHEQRTCYIVEMKHQKEVNKGRRCIGSTESTSTSTLSNEVCHPAESRHMTMSIQELNSQNVLHDHIIDSTSDINRQSDFIKAIVQANEKHNSMFHILKDEKDISDRQLRYYNHCRLKDELFGPRYAPCWQEFETFYKITGMAMDNRVEEASVTTEWLDWLCKTSIRFAKAIPGFKDLTLKDQATLVKGGFFEFGNLCTYRGMNPELMVAVFVHGSTFTPNEMSWPGKRVYMHKLIKFSKRLHNLQITKDEDALFQAIVLTSPDRGELEHAGQVERLHWDIVWSLWNLLHQNHDAPRRKFSKIIDCLVEFREFTEYDREFVQNLPFDIPEIHTSELLCEMSDCHCQGIIQQPPCRTAV